MSKTDITERNRRLRIALFGHMQREADRPHTDAEQRAAAAALGVSDHLPEPQDSLPLESRHA